MASTFFENISEREPGRGNCRIGARYRWPQSSKERTGVHSNSVSIKRPMTNQ